jgi:hypothetical protein
MRFIHSADWQIGKVFKQFGAKEESLRQARLNVIERLGDLALTNGARHVLVAGDVYDSDAPSPVRLRAPIERMKPFAEVHWHLLPGNHDPHRPEGVWDRLLQIGLPENVHLHLMPGAAALDERAFLLPAPLARKAESGDVTAWMDGATTPPGALRIGLAHGSVTNFGSEGEATNPIDPARPKSAGLEYLALGDWHRTLQIGPAAWYAGTPEPDRAGGQEEGTALLVDIPAAGASAAVAPITTAPIAGLRARNASATAPRSPISSSGFDWTLLRISTSLCHRWRSSDGLESFTAACSICVLRRTTPSLFMTRWFRPFLRGRLGSKSRTPNAHELDAD